MGMLSENTSCRFKASERHQGIKREINLSMLLKLEYAETFRKFPWGKEALRGTPPPSHTQGEVFIFILSTGK